ncbi:hypothetical protein BGW39_004877, partial [Mortierella sp. 14UC]
MSSLNQPVSIGPQEYSQFRSQIDALVARFAALSLSDQDNATATAVTPGITHQENNTSNEYLPHLDVNDLWALFTQDVVIPSFTDVDALRPSAETREGDDDAAI